MDELLKQLYIKSKELDQIITYAENYLETAPEGTLRITKNHNTEQFYIKKDSKDTYGLYISKKNMDLIHGLAQRDYAQKLLNLVKEEKKGIQQLIKIYEPQGIENIYEQLPLKRQKIVDPYILPNKEFVDQWMLSVYERKSIDIDESSQITTERGEIVRSKSEKILADKLHLMGIPYHYEKPLYINGYGYINPDFTVLNIRTRKEYYWEHLGLMDQPIYCENAIKKVEAMQRNGFHLGNSLILTFETSKHPINVKIVEVLIRKYLI